MGLALLQGGGTKTGAVGAQQLKTEGWGMMKEAVVGSEVEGLYGLLRRVTSWTPIHTAISTSS